MGLFNRNKRDDDMAVRDRGDSTERPADRNRYKRGITRAWFTLLGVAAAGFLTWLAANSFTPAGSESDFWIAMGLIAGAGLALGFSQLFGGWTKWGVPRISSGVFLFGWIPTAIATGWILLTVQPAGGWGQGRLESWSDSIGILGFVQNFAEYRGVVALTLGLVTAFIFDTSGPKRRDLGTTDADRRRTVPDEDVHDYRREDTGATATDDRERVPASSTAADEQPVESRPTRRDTP